MPSSQLVWMKLMSRPRLANTNKPLLYGTLPQLIASLIDGSLATRAIPFASVTPLQSACPEQVVICTCAPAAGLPWSRVVTQTSDDSRPHLKWTERLVTNAEVGTYISEPLPISEAPSISLAI